MNPCGRRSLEGGLADGEKGVYVQTHAETERKKVQRGGSRHRRLQLICFMLCYWLYSYADESAAERLWMPATGPVKEAYSRTRLQRCLLWWPGATVPGVQVINFDWHCLREIYMNLSRNVSSWNKLLFLRQGLEGKYLALEEVTELEKETNFPVCKPVLRLQSLTCIDNRSAITCWGAQVCLYLLQRWLVLKGIILHFAGLIHYSVKRLLL